MVFPMAWLRGSSRAAKGSIFAFMGLRPLKTRAIGDDEVIEWKKLDYVASFNGDFRGTINDLKADVLGEGFLGRPLHDAAKVTVDHHKRVYLCDPQELVECTMVTLTTAWGLDRYIPKHSHW
jgi:hypothetical protein